MRGRYLRVLHFNAMIAHGWGLISATTSQEMIFFHVNQRWQPDSCLLSLLASVTPCIPKALPVSRGVKQIDPELPAPFQLYTHRHPLREDSAKTVLGSSAASELAKAYLDGGRIVGRKHSFLKALLYHCLS